MTDFSHAQLRQIDGDEIKFTRQMEGGMGGNPEEIIAKRVK